MDELKKLKQLSTKLHEKQKVQRASAQETKKEKKKDRQWSPIAYG
jgi:hypothetical protein